jgi:phosphoribosylformimino-5-aminoimidazole carboxamide ribotide isomerase
MTPDSQLIIYPAIDLKDGQGVRLLHGDFDKMTVYAPDPALQARQFTDAGCGWIHVVDLDGAVAGNAVNKEAVASIISTGAKIQLGGGIRDMAAIESWLTAGVSRVILGTAALKDPELVKQAAKAFPDRIAVGADAKDGMIAAEGWLETSQVPVLELVQRFEACGVAAVIFTDISRDGALTGVNADATARLAEQVSIPVIASGGVSSIDDIKACVRLAHKGINGVITGRALYDGRLDLAEALAYAKGGVSC